MIVKKPRIINFSALKQSIKNEINALSVLREKTIENKTRLEKIENKSNKHQKELSFAILDLETIEQDLKIKKEVHQEYMERVAMQYLIDCRDKQDYIDNNESVLRAASIFKNDFSLPSELKNHLKEVLSVNTSTFDEEQKVAFYLALKKEVEICNNYKIYQKKGDDYFDKQNMFCHCKTPEFRVNSGEPKKCDICKKIL